MTAIQLEDYLFQCENGFPLETPQRCIEIYKHAINEGVPTAMGYHESVGYFLLQTGQGPYIAWQEKNYVDTYGELLSSEERDKKNLEFMNDWTIAENKTII